MKNTYSFIIIFILLIGTYIFFQWRITDCPTQTFCYELHAFVNNLSEKQSNPSSSNQIPLEQVNNLGYTFYLGQIDYPNTNDLTDDLKNQITQIVYNAKFPESMLKNIPIIIVNSLAYSDNQYIIEPSNGLSAKLPPLNTMWLSEGASYSRYRSGQSLIYINKIVLNNNFAGDLTHELGHAVAGTLTAQEWKEYYALRGIPANMPLEDDDGNDPTESYASSPSEDFADVYENVITRTPINTDYGAVDSQTRDFLNQIVNRLN